MPRKKKKISDLPKKLKKPVLLVFFVGILVISYYLGFQQGVNKAQVQSEQVNLENHGQKIEKLTFFDSLHEPLHENQATIAKEAANKTKILPEITIAQKEDDQSKLEEQKSVEVKKVQPEEPKQPVEVAKFGKEPVQKPSKPIVQKKSKSIDELKREPWAVQVGAFQDGVKAVLLRKELEQKGFGAYTLTVKHESLEIFRVMVAASSESVSQRISADLQKDGYSSSFVIKR